jgi:hypothetical protein
VVLVVVVMTSLILFLKHQQTLELVVAVEVVVLPLIFQELLDLKVILEL